MRKQLGRPPADPLDAATVKYADKGTPVETLSEEEYAALPVKDPDTLYVII